MLRGANDAYAFLRLARELATREGATSPASLSDAFWLAAEERYLSTGRPSPLS